MYSPHTLPTIGLNKKTTLIRTMASDDDDITILGFGSLLSEKSSRTTFPTLKSFRLGRVLDHRRTFAHPASIFFQRNIAKLETLEMSSLSVEYKKGSSMVCSVFEVPNEGLAAADAPGDNFVPSQAFLEREEEFEITKVDYEEIASSGSNEQEIKQGVICRRSTDEAYIARWGQERFQKNYLDYGIKTIWGWNEGIRPCVSSFCKRTCIHFCCMSHLNHTSFMLLACLSQALCTGCMELRFRREVVKRWRWWNLLQELP